MNEGIDTSHWPSSKEIREWANARRPGYVKDKGQLPRAVILAWDRSHPDRKYVAAEGFHGTVGGYNNRDCRCDRCSDAVAAYSRDRRLNDADDEATALLLDEPA